MGLCTLIKTDRVLYDERVFIPEKEDPIPGVVVPEGYSINEDKSSVEVAVVECDVVRDNGALTGDVDVTLYIKKHIVASKSGSPDISFDFSFQKLFPVHLVKFSEATISSADAARADCQIVDVSATDTLSVTSARNINDDLMVTVMLKLVVPHDQILVVPCPANMSTMATVTVTTTAS